MKNVSIGNLFILGDSYSTFEGLVPEGYNVWYHNVIINDTDVSAPEHTWWRQLIAETDARLVLNSSYSGTTVGHTGYDRADCSAISFCARLDRLAEEGFFEKNRIDTCIVFGGTNDSWSDAPLGCPQYAGWSRDDLFTVLPAVYYLAHRVRQLLPAARTVFVVNSGLKPEITAALHDACARNGLESIQISDDVSKRSRHPDRRGMTQIKDQVLGYFAAHPRAK